MSSRFIGLPVFYLGDQRSVGVVERRHSSPERGEELLVRSPPPDTVVRRVGGAAVNSVGSVGVSLGIERERFLSLPRYVPDQELEAAIRETLSTSTPGCPISVQVQDGAVLLRGSIPTVREREEAVERVRSMQGVMRVRDELVAVR